MNKSDCGIIYEQYRKKVLGYVSSKINNRSEAEDVFQTVFLKICKNIDKYNPDRASLSTWIYTITRNTVYDSLKRMRSHPEVELSDDISEQSETVEDCAIKKVSLETLAVALEKLSPEERDVIILTYYHGKRKNEVADILGITYGQLRYLHDRAIERLGKLM
ncbi:MAG: RNA polymerase sigma factor [Christensenellales bacterium]